MRPDGRKEWLKYSQDEASSRFRNFSNASINVMDEIRVSFIRRSLQSKRKSCPTVNQPQQQFTKHCFQILVLQIRFFSPWRVTIILLTCEFRCVTVLRQAGNSYWFLTWIKIMNIIIIIIIIILSTSLWSFKQQYYKLCTKNWT